MKSKIETNRDLHVRDFLRFASLHILNSFEFWLVYCADCLCCYWPELQHWLWFVTLSFTNCTNVLSEHFISGTWFSSRLYYFTRQDTLLLVFSQRWIFSCFADWSMGLLWWVQPYQHWSVVCSGPADPLHLVRAVSWCYALCVWRTWNQPRLVLWHLHNHESW